MTTVEVRVKRVVSVQLAYNITGVNDVHAFVCHSVRTGATTQGCWGKVACSEHNVSIKHNGHVSIVLEYIKR